MVGKTAICSLDTSSVWTDLEFGNSIQNGITPLQQIDNMLILCFIAENLSRIKSSQRIFL